MKKQIPFWILFIFIVTGCAAVQNREEIGVLIDYGNNQQSQEKAVEKETETFEAVRKSVLKGTLSVGMPASEVEKKLGNPVIRDGSASSERWVYKAGDSNWLSGEVIRLYFDDQSNLKRWHCANLECPKS